MRRAGSAAGEANDSAIDDETGGVVGEAAEGLGAIGGVGDTVAPAVEFERATGVHGEDGGVIPGAGVKRGGLENRERATADRNVAGEGVGRAEEEPPGAVFHQGNAVGGAAVGNDAGDVEAACAGEGGSAGAGGAGGEAAEAEHAGVGLENVVGAADLDGNRAQGVFSGEIADGGDPDIAAGDGDGRGRSDVAQGGAELQGGRSGVVVSYLDVGDISDRVGVGDADRALGGGGVSGVDTERAGEGAAAGEDKVSDPGLGQAALALKRKRKGGGVLVDRDGGGAGGAGVENERGAVGGDEGPVLRAGDVTEGERADRAVPVQRDGAVGGDVDGGEVGGGSDSIGGKGGAPVAHRAPGAIGVGQPGAVADHDRHGDGEHSGVAGAGGISGGDDKLLEPVVGVSGGAGKGAIGGDLKPGGAGDLGEGERVARVGVGREAGEGAGVWLVLRGGASGDRGGGKPGDAVCPLHGGDLRRAERVIDDADVVDHAGEKRIGGEAAPADVVQVGGKLGGRYGNGAGSDLGAVEVEASGAAGECERDVAPLADRQGGVRLDRLLGPVVTGGEAEVAAGGARGKEGVARSVAPQVEDALPVGAAVPVDPGGETEGGRARDIGRKLEVLGIAVETERLAAGAAGDKSGTADGGGVVALAGGVERVALKGELGQGPGAGAREALHVSHRRGVVAVGDAGGGEAAGVVGHLAHVFDATVDGVAFDPGGLVHHVGELGDARGVLGVAGVGAGGPVGAVVELGYPDGAAGLDVDGIEPVVELLGGEAAAVEMDGDVVDAEPGGVGLGHEVVEPGEAAVGDGGGAHAQAAGEKLRPDGNGRIHGTVTERGVGVLDGIVGLVKAGEVGGVGLAGGKRGPPALLTYGNVFPVGRGVLVVVPVVVPGCVERGGAHVAGAFLGHPAPGEHADVTDGVVQG